MLNDIQKIRVLRKSIEKSKNKFELKQFPKQKEWLNNFLKLKEEDQIKLITILERSQVDTIIKSFHSMDPYITVPCFGVFFISEERKYALDFLTNKGYSYEEREKMLKEHFKEKWNKNK